MTISSTYSPDSYAGNGSTDTFAITFEFLSVSTNVKVSIKVDSTGVITEKTASTHYNISGSNVVFTAGNIPASGETIIIELNPDFKQQTDYKENNALAAETLETDLDERTLESQINKDNADRSLKLDASVSGVTNTIVVDSTIANNASKFIRFNENGDGFEVIALSSTAGLADIVDDVTPQLGGNLDLNSKNISGTGNISNTGTITASGAVTGGSLSTTGNITVGGTVDGRDVATDGTKLDGIEALADVTDEANVKSALDGATITAATVASTDKVLIQDVDDTDNLKTVTAQSIADLASAASAATQAEQETATSTTVFVSPGRQQYHPSAAKAWVQFDGTAGTISPAGSYNVTSLTDNSTGNYTVTWDTDFSGTGYSTAGSQGGGARTMDIQSYAIGTILIRLFTLAGAAQDGENVSVVAYGDQ